MKKSIRRLICALISAALLLSLSACKGASDKDTATGGSSEYARLEPSGDTGTLVVYFSWSGAGNTEKMANVIKERTGADILRIEPAKAYPTDYDECGEVAKVERDEDARPELANLPKDLDGYDTVFIGYPIWWHTAPMIIGTFLESFDFTEKDVYPFAQSASMNAEQFENSMQRVREWADGAVVHDGLFVSASETEAIAAYADAAVGKNSSEE